MLCSIKGIGYSRAFYLLSKLGLNIFIHLSIIMTSLLKQNLIELERDKVLSEVKERLTQGEKAIRIIEIIKVRMA